MLIRCTVDAESSNILAHARTHAVRCSGPRPRHQAGNCFSIPTDAIFSGTIHCSDNCEGRRQTLIVLHVLSGTPFPTSSLTTRICLSCGTSFGCAAQYSEDPLLGSRVHVNATVQQKKSDFLSDMSPPRHEARSAPFRSD